MPLMARVHRDLREAELFTQTENQCPPDDSTVHLRNGEASVSDATLGVMFGKDGVGVHLWMSGGRKLPVAGTFDRPEGRNVPGCGRSKAQRRSHPRHDRG